MSWLTSLFGGSKPAQADVGTLQNTGASLTSQGMGELSKASGFWGGVLSGDSSKQSQLLAPEIGAVKTSAQQDEKKNSMFSSRSGGTAAASAAGMDKVHADIATMLSGIVGGAASNLGSLGSSTVNAGIGATQASGSLAIENKKLNDAAMFGPFWHGG